MTMHQLILAPKIQQFWTPLHLCNLCHLQKTFWYENHSQKETLRVSVFTDFSFIITILKYFLGFGSMIICTSVHLFLFAQFI